MTLVKPDLGTKRVCPSCGARFYDLQRRPIACPKCAFTFEPEMLMKQRRQRVEPPAPIVPPPVVEKEPVEAEEAPIEPAEEAEDAEPVAEAEEVAEAPEAPEAAPVEDATEEEFEEEEVEEDDGLLEEVEEEEDDVAGIIDTDIGKEEP